MPRLTARGFPAVRYKPFLCSKVRQIQMAQNRVFLGSVNTQSCNAQISFSLCHDAQLRAPLCNVVGLHALTMWRGGDAHFHCNLTRQTGVVGGSTPALESTQWEVQARLRELKKSKHRDRLISRSTSWLCRSNSPGTGTWRPPRRPCMASHQFGTHSVKSRM